MHQGTLIVLYLVVGVACGGVYFHRCTERGAREVASSLTLVALWPLWAPFAMGAAPTSPRGPFASRIALALERAGSPSLNGDAGGLDRGEMSALMKQVDAAEQRLCELDAQVALLREQSPGILPQGSDDAQERARIRAASVAQLEALRDREQRALLELADTCDLLRAQHLVSRFGGAGATETADLRDELWARVQALAVLDGEQ